MVSTSAWAHLLVHKGRVMAQRENGDGRATEKGRREPRGVENEQGRRRCVMTRGTSQDEKVIGRSER